MVTVMNLATGDKLTYSCSPREAVVAAYAYGKRDGNTWLYEQRYGHLVESSSLTWLCGDWSAFKDGRQF